MRVCPRALSTVVAAEARTPRAGFCAVRANSSDPGHLLIIKRRRRTRAGPIGRATRLGPRQQVMLPHGGVHGWASTNPHLRQRVSWVATLVSWVSGVVFCLTSTRSEINTSSSHKHCVIHMTYVCDGRRRCEGNLRRAPRICARLHNHTPSCARSCCHCTQPCCVPMSLIVTRHHPTITTLVVLGARLRPAPLGSGRIGGLGQAGRAQLVPVATCPKSSCLIW